MFIKAKHSSYFYVFISAVVHSVCIFLMGLSFYQSSKNYDDRISISLTSQNLPGQKAEARQLPRVSKHQPLVPDESAQPAPAESPIASKSVVEVSDNSGGGTDAGTRTEADANSLVRAYVANIVVLLNRNKIYPQEALAREQEGRVVLEMLLNSQGVIKELMIKDLSKFESLNRAALLAAKSVHQFPPLPEGMAEFRFSIPLLYKIEN